MGCGASKSGPPASSGSAPAAALSDAERVTLAEKLSAAYRLQPELVAAAEQLLGVELLKGTAADAVFEENAWSPYNGAHLVATSFDVIERTVNNTIMDGLVAADAPEFDYTPAGYIETMPLGMGKCNYVVVGYVSAEQRVVRVACTPEDETPDPSDPGQLALCTFSNNVGDGVGDFCYEYQSKELGRFKVTCKAK